MAVISATGGGVDETADGTRHEKGRGGSGFEDRPSSSTEACSAWLAGQATVSRVGTTSRLSWHARASHSSNNNKCALPAFNWILGAHIDLMQLTTRRASDADLMTIYRRTGHVVIARPFTDQRPT